MENNDDNVVKTRGRTFRFSEPTYQDVLTSRDENAKADLADARLLARTVKEVKADGEHAIPLADVLKLPIGVTSALSRKLKKFFDEESFEDAEKN